MRGILDWLAVNAWAVLSFGGLFVVLAGGAAAYFLWRGLRRGGTPSRLSPPTQPASHRTPPGKVSRHEAPTVPPEKPAVAASAPLAGAEEDAEASAPVVDEEMQALLDKLETYSATLAEDEILPLGRAGKISKDAIRRMIKRLEASKDREAEEAGEE